ncbi:MAG: response regulator, partial [Leptospiraceae bacterium]|nr:response regulator [Leptospiraceae bacterium]
SHFLANMSHEIRTPLNAIIGLNQIALRSTKDNELKEFLEKIELSSRSLLGIINDILDFSKIEAGKLIIQKVQFSIDEVLFYLASVSHYTSGDKNIQIYFIKDKNIPDKLFSDEIRISQVLLNFLSNSIKFTDSGKIELNIQILETTDSEVLIKFTVKDTGIGVSEENLKKLFKPFTQADGSITRKFGGTGLGLVISKYIIEKLNGKLSFKSSINEGTEVSFKIPFEFQKSNIEKISYPNVSIKLNILDKILNSSITGVIGELDLKINDNLEKETIHFYDYEYFINNNKEIESFEGNRKDYLIASPYHAGKLEKNYKIPPQNIILLPVEKKGIMNLIHKLNSEIQKNSFPVEKEKQVLQGKNILIVEDNKMNQMVVKKMLKKMGANSFVSENGEEALNFIFSKKEIIHAVFMDMQMPVMDGLEATVKIRKNSEFKNLPIIAMTANAFLEDKEKCMSAGMNDYISKPIDYNLIRDKLLEWISD